MTKAGFNTVVGFTFLVFSIYFTINAFKAGDWGNFIIYMAISILSLCMFYKGYSGLPRN